MLSHCEAIEPHVHLVARLGPPACRLLKVQGRVCLDRRSLVEPDSPPRPKRAVVEQAIRQSSPFEQQSRGIEWIPNNLEVTAWLTTSRDRPQQPRSAMRWTTYWTKSAPNVSPFVRRRRR